MTDIEGVFGFTNRVHPNSVFVSQELNLLIIMSFEVKGHLAILSERAGSSVGS